MIWESVVTATWFNIGMLVLFLGVLVYTRNRLTNTRGAALIYFAFVAQSTVYVVELLALHALPTVTSPETADATLAALHKVRPLVTAAALTAFVIAFIMIQYRGQATIAALREGHRQLSAVLDATPDGILTLDRDGRVTTVNDAAERLFDGGRHWLIGTPIRELLPDVPIRPDDIVTVNETVARRRTGSQFTASVTVLRSGRRRGEHVVTVRDITHQQELEAALRRSQRLDAVGQLSGGIAHDFNNQLTVILGHVEALQRADLPGELSQSVDRIRDAAQHSTRLTHQLLAFSRRQILAPRVVNVNRSIEQLLELIRSSVGEHITVKTMLSADVANVRVDPSQLEQALMNLVLNARDALEKGGTLCIETANVRLDERFCATHADAVPGAYVMLAVIDDGAGIDAESLEHIFEPFFSTREVGRGLGLATVQGIVAQSQGTIDVVSELGRGTTFKLFLPRVDEAAEPEVAPAAVAAPGARGERVLVVEDQVLLRELTVATLTRAGYEVFEAADGEEGIRMGLAHTPDLVVTDVVMPRGSGLDVHRALSATLPDLAVIFVSGYTDELDADPPGPGPLLRKPFTPDQLLGLVRATLDAKAAHRANGA